MNAFLKNGWFKISILIAIFLLLLLSFISCFFRIYSQRDIISFLQMTRSCQPIWKDLALRRIGIGQNVADIILSHPPLRIEKWKNYKGLIYQAAVGPDEVDTTGIVIMAQNDKLIYATAWGSDFNHDFFSTKTKKELDEIYDEYSDNKKIIREAKKAKASNNTNSPPGKTPEN